MTCDYKDCSKSAHNTGIIGGVFGNWCAAHFDIHRPQSAQYAKYSREQDREKHQGDLVQPWKNGKPNPEFAELYPEYAKETYTKEELESLDRDF